MYLLDTNVLSELPRPRPSESVLRFLSGRHDFAISAITVEEVAFGIARAKAAQRRKLASWFDALMETGILVHDVTTPIARAAAELRAAREAAGRRVAQADMLIAATALVHGLTLATRNTSAFEDCGILMFDPFVP